MGATTMVVVSPAQSCFGCEDRVLWKQIEGIVRLLNSNEEIVSLSRGCLRSLRLITKCIGYIPMMRHGFDGTSFSTLSPSSNFHTIYRQLGSSTRDEHHSRFLPLLP